MVAVETPEKSSNLQSEETSEGTGLEFEEPDFDAITKFVESDDEETLVAPETKIAEEPAAVEEVVVEDPAPEEPVVEEKPSESPEPEKVVEEKPEAVVAKEPETPAVVEPDPEPEPEPVVKVPTREDLEGMYKEHRAKTLPQLEQIFRLTEEQAAALDEQPSKVIPKLAGQMMYDTMLSTYNAVMTALPRVVGTYMEATKQANTAQDAFYDEWPDLNNAKANSAVSAAIQAYRAANPRAKLDTVIKNAGVMAMINLGLDPLKKQVPSVPVKRAAPAKPAAPRGASPIPPVKPGSEETNPFDELTKLIEEEDA